jgi:hydroxyacyl-ACP dehydratase HTD2-like protein with hotdog domain
MPFVLLLTICFFQSVLEAMWLSAHVSLGYRNLRYLFDSQLLELLIYRPNHMLLHIAYCSEA